MTQLLSDAVRQFAAHVQPSAEATVINDQPPSCELCGGLGYLRYDVEVGHPNFGKLYHCTNPNCEGRNRNLHNQVASLMKLSDWEASYDEWTFERFLEYSRQRGAQKGKMGGYIVARAFADSNMLPFTLEQASQYVYQRAWAGENNNLSSASVVLTGAVGMGKTSLAVAAVNALRAQNKLVVFIRAAQLIARFQDTYVDDGYPTDMDVALKYANIPYLVLDEFHLENPTARQLTLFTELVRERDRRNLPILATTNLTPDEFSAKWKPQLADIMFKAHWIGVIGDKLRATSRKVVTL